MLNLKHIITATGPLRFARRNASSHQSQNELETLDWRRDPLTHPALQAMSERERADLPFDPHQLLSD